MKEQMLKDYYSVKKGTYVYVKLAGTNYQISSDDGKTYFAIFDEQERREYIGYPENVDKLKQE